MKVLLINNIFYRRGGSEAVFYNTADLLREAGHEVVFFSYKDEHNLPCEQEPYFIDKGGKLEQVRSYFYNKKAAKQLERLIADEKPDIAHLHLFWGGMSPSVLEVLKRNGVPAVHTAHDYRMVCPAYLLKDGGGAFCERCKGGKFYNCALHKCSKGSIVESLLMMMEMYFRNRYYYPLNLLSGVIFVSNFSRQKHIDFDKRFESVKTEILYNCPCDLVKHSLDIERDTYSAYYLFYGRLSEEKGVSTLIKALEKLPEIHLKIVGTGPLEDELKNYCKEKEITNVSFLGYKTGKELYDIVAQAKYVCVPSECYENNPMTIVEAYSLGTPIIGAAIGGISEIVGEEKTGFLFESGDVDSLCEAVEKSFELGEEDYKQMKKSAREFAKYHFESDRYKEKLIGFYKEIIESRCS